MKEFRLEENLGHLTLEQFFELFFEGDTFSYQWHEKRGNTDIHLGPWTKAPDGNRKQRLIRFTPPPAAHPMLKRFTSNTKFKEVLHFHITPNGEAIATAVTMGEGGSSVDLETRVEWTARLDDKDGTLHCTIVGKDEYKRKLFKEMMENFMRESTEANMGLWVELVRRHLHHMGFTSPMPAHRASLVSHPSSSWEDEAGEESDEHGEVPAVIPDSHVQKRGHDGNHVGVVTVVPHVRAEEVQDSDEDEDDDDARFVDAGEVMLLGEHGVSTAEEVVVLRAAVKGLEREVSNMERQLSKALTRVAGLQQTVQEVTGDSAALSLSLPSLHQRLAALEHAQASATAAAEQAALLSPLTPAATNGVLPPTPDELEQAVRDIEIERRVSRRNGRKSRASLNRSGLSSSSSPSPLAPLPPPAPMNTNDTQLPPPAAMSVTSSGSVPPPLPPPLSSPALPAKRRKLMWAGVATLVVLSISLALPLLAPRSALLDRLLRPLRSLSLWPFSLSFSRSIDAAPSPASK